MNPSQSISNLLDAAHVKWLSEDALASKAVALAALLLTDAKQRETPVERAQAAKIARMMEDPNGKTMTMAMSDQVFRSHHNDRIADQLNHLVSEMGVPKYLGNWEQWALWLGSTLGEYIPSMVVPFVVAKLRQETRSVILPSEEQEFRNYVNSRRKEGVRLNLNQLGEAILGEDEAARRLDAYLKLLARDDVEYISVKISSIFSQINLLAFDATVAQIKERLRKLYRAAMKHRFVTAEGVSLPKFVNLDMEEYRDLNLTVAAFKQTLDEDEFKLYRAGIVLQAYLPDAHAAQQNLTEWAMIRLATGGASIKIRIVKGANLAMERVEAELHGWTQAPYHSKPEVDANYKRMLIYGMLPAHAQAVNLGIASHNLFDVAYALLLRVKYDVQAFTEMEMLEGMANHQARSVKDAANGMLLYAPVVKREDFHSAISYLVRRLDENTAPENFLHDLFSLEPNSASWERQKLAFLQAVQARNTGLVGAQRQQNYANGAVIFADNAPFANTSDTDWSLPHHQKWVADIAKHWHNAIIEALPLQIAGQFVPPTPEGNNRIGIGRDPSRPDRIAYHYALADQKQIDTALVAATAAQAEWGSTPITTRKTLLLACAQKLTRARADLIGVMMLDGGKTAPEADTEISEAIDFANYYARAFDDTAHLADLEHTSLGVVLVTPPWNFPLAIPAGGVLAALMAGNAVILKPAPEAVLTSWHLCQTLWAAGIPKNVLQFVPTSDDEIGKSLVTDARVNAVILTGAYATARMFLSWKPDLNLLAETSGKNSMIVTAMADHDQAIKDLVKSAFGHAGQKCSAASLAVLEAEVYDNSAFMKQLRDAAASLQVGSAWDLSSVVTPLIREPNNDLKRGLQILDKGETWLLQPKIIDDNPNLWSPGIKLGVKRDSWYHRNECFGPVLGLMRASNFNEAIEIVNDNEFGLTSGLQSLDEREIALWRDKIEAGNGYINRSTTGAIVQRQPFGGWKKSVFGQAKAGGPNYVFALCKWTQRDLPSQMTALSAEAQSLVNGLQDWLVSSNLAYASEWITASANNYAWAWQQHFGITHDPSKLLAESNVFRYRPIHSVLIRVDNSAVWVDALQAVLAAKTCGVKRIVISVLPGCEPKSALFLSGVEFDIEDDASFAKNLPEFERVRVFTNLAPVLRELAIDAHVLIIDTLILANGRLELRHYVREQAITQTMHRYGNVASKR